LARPQAVVLNQITGARRSPMCNQAGVVVGQGAQRKLALRNVGNRRPVFV